MNLSRLFILWLIEEMEHFVSGLLACFKCDKWSADQSLPLLESDKLHMLFSFFVYIQ